MHIPISFMWTSSIFQNQRSVNQTPIINPPPLHYIDWVPGVISQQLNSIRWKKGKSNLYLEKKNNNKIVTLLDRIISNTDVATALLQDEFYILWNTNEIQHTVRNICIRWIVLQIKLLHFPRIREILYCSLSRQYITKMQSNTYIHITYIWCTSIL